MMENNNYLDKGQNEEPKSKWSGFDFYEEKFVSFEIEESITEIKAPLDAGKSFPLAMASIGEQLLIVKLKGSESTVRRLIGMGLVPGCEVQIISSTNGSVIVAIGDNRVGLGAGMAQKIMCSNY
jgi:ferrous iron transport protein A